MPWRFRAFVIRGDAELGADLGQSRPVGRTGMAGAASALRTEATADLGDIARSPAPAPTSPAQVLRAEAGVTSFLGRDAESKRLMDWLDDPSASRVLLVTGRGGQGKTRLALDLVDRLRKESRASWRAGVLAANVPEPQLVRPLGDVLDRALLVVDYAETRGAVLVELLRAVERARGRLRLLLLARGRGDWTERPGSEDADLDEALDTGVEELALRSLLAGHVDTRQLWQDAVTAHARALEPLGHCAPGAADDVLRVALRHEQRYWDRSARERRLDVDPDTRADAVAGGGAGGGGGRGPGHGGPGPPPRPP